MQTKNKTISAVIIDDEIAAIEILSVHLNNYCPNIHILGVADNFYSGILLLQQYNPQLVFLDIELNDPNGNGIELMECYGYDNTSIIFFTGYDKYVQESYRLSAIHYIKKPISIVALKEAVKRAEQQIVAQKAQPSFYKLSTLKGIEFIPFKDIIWLEADGAVTHIYGHDKWKKTSSETLGEIEKKLPAKDFYRIHRSHIINRAYVREYQKEGVVVLSDGTTANVAVGQVKGFLSWFLDG